MSPHTVERLFLLVGKPPQVVSLNPDGSDLRVLVSNTGGTPDGIAVNTAEGFLYWTNMGEDYCADDGFIERCRLDGSERQRITRPGDTFTPKQLLLDVPNGLMYWSDREGMRVMRARLDGTEVTTLVQTGATEEERRDETRHCVGIAIDTAAKKMYWTQKGPPNGRRGRIFRAGLDRTDGETETTRTDIELLFDELPEPIDLELDLVGGYLYWTDRGDPPDGNTLNRAKLNETGLGDHEILCGGLQEGIGLTLSHRRGAIFTSDLGGFVRQFDGPAFSSSKVVRSLDGLLTGIACAEVPADQR